MQGTKPPAMPPTDPPAWLAFEADALPHAEGLFRLAMWFERDRNEAEDLVHETYARAPSFAPLPTQRVSTWPVHSKDRLTRAA